MTTQDIRLNDVNISAVGDLAGAISEEPTRGATTWRSTVRWDGGFRSSAFIRDFPPIASDEPVGLGGTDTAPNPVEQLLGALGNCLAVGYAAGATAAGIEIRDLTIELEGDLDLHTFLGLRPGHAGYDDVRVRVHLDTDAPPERLDELHASVVGTSPVGHTLNAAIPLAIDLA
jgi:uncharacterized OsmC-like protein